jgi:hypothetical protein
MEVGDSKIVRVIHSVHAKISSALIERLAGKFQGSPRNTDYPSTGYPSVTLQETASNSIEPARNPTVPGGKLPWINSAGLGLLTPTRRAGPSRRRKGGIVAPTFETV